MANLLTLKVLIFRLRDPWVKEYFSCVPEGPFTLICRMPSSCTQAWNNLLLVKLEGSCKLTIID